MLLRGSRIPIIGSRSASDGGDGIGSYQRGRRRLRSQQRCVAHRRTTGRRSLTLNHSLSRMQLSPAVRQSAEMQRSKLAGAQIQEPLIMHAFDEPFDSGFRDVVWISVGRAFLQCSERSMRTVSARK